MESTKILKRWIITAHKRSLGQGNVFTPVCYSARGRGYGNGVGCVFQYAIG